MSKRKRDEREANATEDWRESVKQVTTTERNYYQYMLEHDILTDCTFVVGPEDGETREFKAHRLHIARVSVVFEAMLLRGEMVEAKTGHVRVTDLSPNTFQLLLSSIYGKDPEMTTFHEAQDLAFAAHKYQMKALLEICITRICALIKSSNIWTAFETADLLQEERLTEKCIQVLQHDTLRCITDARFMQASEENVALLLEQDELNVDDEQLLVNSIVHWARHAARQRGLSDDDSGVRAVLEPRLLSLFRLLAMSPQQFMLGPGLAGWLTSDEKATISECLESKASISKLPQNLCSITSKRKIVTSVAGAVQILSKDRFGNFICRREIVVSRPNVQQTRKECCLHRVRLKFDNEYYNCVHATLIFRVNSSCNLLGIRCASRFRADPTAFKTKSPLYHENIVAAAYTFNHTLSTDFKKIKIGDTTFEKKTRYNACSKVMFDTPLPLVSDNWFAVEVALRHYGSDVPAGEYPNPSRAQHISTETGVQFDFHSKEKEEGFYTSMHDGIVTALFFSL